MQPSSRSGWPSRPIISTCATSSIRSTPKHGIRGKECRRTRISLSAKVAGGKDCEKRNWRASSLHIPSVNPFQLWIFSEGLVPLVKVLRRAANAFVSPTPSKSGQVLRKPLSMSFVFFVRIIYFPELLTDEIRLVPLFIINARIPCSVMRSSFVKAINPIHLCSYLMERHQSLHLQNPAKSK
jgi:hypothetical protein